jgi:hypothetical protein
MRYPSPMPSSTHVGISLALLAFSCPDPQAVSERATKEAKAAADQVVEAGVDKGKEVVEAGVDKGKEVVEAGVDGAKAQAKALVDDIPDTGELSEKSRGWLESAGEAGDGVVPLVAKGTQLAPVALEIGKTVNDAVDKDYAVEPIYQEIGDEAAQKELDEKLAKMPKTQEIDGVRVGFKQLSEVSSEKKVDESAYIVLWRRDDHLVGFIYRTRSEIDVDKLAAETPRLVGLVNQALETHG